MAELLTRTRMRAALDLRRRVDEAERALFGELPSRCLYSVQMDGIKHPCDLPPGHETQWHAHFNWAATGATLTWTAGQS